MLYGKRHSGEFDSEIWRYEARLTRFFTGILLLLWLFVRLFYTSFPVIHSFYLTYGQWLLGAGLFSLIFLVVNFWYCLMNVFKI